MNIKAKLTSRKFLLAVTSIVTGILTLCNFSENTIAVVSSSIMTVVPVMVYIIMEGKIDAAGIKTIVNATTDGIEAIGKEIKEREKDGH